jgi:hypothetical protein
MSKSQALFYDIESLFIDGANITEIAAALRCTLTQVGSVLSTFGVDIETFDTELNDMENDFDFG